MLTDDSNYNISPKIDKLREKLDEIRPRSENLPAIPIVMFIQVNFKFVI